MPQDITVPRELQNGGVASPEILRKGHRPDRVSVLLVGESPPANGTFFYSCNSNLYRSTKEAFEQAFGQRFGTGRDFLTFFKQLGFYLDDLLPEPINKLNKAVRRKLRREAIAVLVVRIQQHSPEYVIAVMKGIEPYVREAAVLASLPVDRVFALPFPVRGNQGRYVKDLTALLRGWRRITQNR